MRLVSTSVDQALTSAPGAPVNFGLLFNKFLQYRQNRNMLEPVVKQGNGLLVSDYQRSKNQAEILLKQRHLQQAAYCQAMEAAGWRSFVVHARLTSPFVSGLGMAHPTETGMVLDHTSGMPYIPASGQKGLLRLAHLVNSLCDDTGQWLEEEQLKRAGTIKRGKDGQWQWIEDAASQTLFGSGGERDALAGQLKVLDAYPLTPPELGEEILNPHFGDYYKGNRGPTEDQSPNPVKFLVIRPGAEFVFRLLLRTPFTKATEKEQGSLPPLVEESLNRAISTEGVGAKTALGFGRFEVLAKHEPERITIWQKEADERQKPWMKVIVLINGIENNWGQLKQAAFQENAPAAIYQAKPELAQAVKDAALRIRTANPKKWDATRDEQLSGWLAAAGINWEVDQDAGHGSAVSLPAHSSEDRAAVDSVDQIPAWNNNLLSQVDVENLSLAALTRLQERMKIEWGCGGRRVRKDKQKAWKIINKLISQRRKG